MENEKHQSTEKFDLDNVAEEYEAVASETLQSDEEAFEPLDTVEADSYCAPEAEGCEAEAVAETVSDNITEEAIETLKAKKKRKTVALIVTVILVLVLAVSAYCVCVMEGVGAKSVVNTSVYSTDEEAFKNVKYQNPIVEMLGNVTGRSNGIVATVGDEKVEKDVFEFVVNSAGLNYAYYMLNSGALTSLDDFDWNAPDADTDMTTIEVVKGTALETLVPIYALISEGKKNGIVLSDDEEKQIADWVAKQKEYYGDEFEEVLLKNGYASEDVLVKVQRLQLYMQKVYTDAGNDISKYVSENDFSKYDSGDKVTVKHILVQFDSDENGNVSEEAKLKAKDKAEEVLAKINSGEDFDSLIDEYNDDPGQGEDGYTFANDGTMEQAFADAAFALEIGDVSDLVETSYGYHIIKRLERRYTVDDCVEMLQNTVPVRINKSVYKDMKVTVNLNDFFGASADE